MLNISNMRSQMPQHIIASELFFLWAWQQNYCLFAFYFPKVCLLSATSLLLAFPNFKASTISKMSSKLLTVFSCLSSTPRCRLLFIFVCQVKFVSVAVSLLTVSSGSLFIFFAPAICFNCLDKVNGLTNVYVAEILWAIFCPCGGTYYYCNFFLVLPRYWLSHEHSPSLISAVERTPCRRHDTDSAQFRVVCVKVPESRCIMAASVWPQSNVRICYMVGAAAPHMAPLMEIGLAGGYA